MQTDWDKLLEKLGIAKAFCDAVHREHAYTVSDEALLKMVNHLGFPLKKIEDSGMLLEKLNNRRWQYVLEPIYVVKAHDISFDAVLRESDADDFELELQSAEGDDVTVEYTYEKTAEKFIGTTKYVRLQIKIDANLAPQYYQLQLRIKDKNYRSTLAVTPQKCYVPRAINEHRLWGFAIQLYSLTSKRNWGVGDFTDLLEFVKMCHCVGADVIGVNPLNVLTHDYPENASPYASVSRLFLNPIYIDVEKISGYRADFLKGNEAELERLRQSPNIDYTGVYNLKISILRKVFAAFRKLKTEYTAFEEYCAEKGEDLEGLAAYQTIYSAYKDKVYNGWRSWPQELQNPRSKAVQDFCAAHADEVLFFKFLQYCAETQLRQVYKKVESYGLKIGLYRDLPVGLSKDSVELWMNESLFIKDCGAGAPPDVFFPTGQRWALGAFNPFALKEAAYVPFIRILRAAMEGAGALRIDHVMSLMRLYILPDNEKEEGTYVYYNFDDMLGIVALESHLNKCMVVGESIGNVPDGFIEKLHDRGLYSLSVVWAERWNGVGDFKAPYDFPKTAFCSVGTHDMAPLRMRWFGGDIETMYQLGMLSEAERHDQYKGREDERIRLLRVLDYNGMWPQDKPRQGDCLYGEGYPNGLTEAVEKYAAAGCSVVYLAQLEDIFGVEVLQNLPGTDRDKHPNWRRKLPVKLEDYTSRDDFNRAMDIISSERE